MTKEHFEEFFRTVYRYLKFINLLDEKVEYQNEIGEKKFQKYDNSGNGSISL